MIGQRTVTARLVCSATMPKLSSDKTLLFIKLYRNEECLWNNNIKAYRDKSMRDASLQRMSAELKTRAGIKMTVKDVKKKIKTLRSTYGQELGKFEKAARAEPGTGKEFKSQLCWFAEMDSFLKNLPIRRKKPDSQESETIDDAPADNSESNNDNNEDVADVENLLAQPSTSAASTSTHKSPPKVPATPTPKRHKIEEMTSLVNEIRSMKDDLKNTLEYEHVIQNIPDENEHDIFGKFVASQLKQLSTTQAILARDQINATLSRCRLQDLNYVDTKLSFQEMDANLT